VWDGDAFTIVWQGSEAVDGEHRIHAARVGDLGEAGVPWQLSYGAGSQKTPDVAWRAGQVAVTWMDVAEPDEAAGGISLLVGPLSCQ